MLHQVTVYDSNGKVKKVLSSKRVTRDHWNRLVQPIGQGSKPHTGQATAKKKSSYKPIGLVDRECDKCHKIKPGRRDNKRFFCHEPCLSDDIRANHQPPTEERKCDDCQEMFLPKQSRHNFCHNPCTYAVWKKKQGKKYKGETDGRTTRKRS